MLLAIFLALSQIQLIKAKLDAVVTDHAIYKGEQLEIGTKGNGTCKYTGNSQITPAWVLRNNEATYSLSAGISAGIYTCFCAGPAHKSLITPLP